MLPLRYSDFGSFLAASCLRRYRMCESLKVPNVAGNNVVNILKACESNPFSKASYSTMDRFAHSMPCTYQLLNAFGCLPEIKYFGKII